MSLLFFLNQDEMWSDGFSMNVCFAYVNDLIPIVGVYFTYEKGVSKSQNWHPSQDI